MGFSVRGRPKTPRRVAHPLQLPEPVAMQLPPPASRKPPLQPSHRLSLSSMKQAAKKSSFRRNLSRRIWSTATPTRSQIRKS